MKRPAKTQMDLTAQTLVERRLLSSAWKEALADLTPGLAHDFNNVLTGILALSQAYLAQIGSAHPFNEGLTLIERKARDASELIHRIMRLHQEKTGSRNYHDVNSTSTEVVEILRKVIPKRIAVSAQCTAGPLPVYVDGVEFSRVLLVLALSAVKTMPDRGKLHFQTSRHETLPPLAHVQGELPRTPAVCVSIIDSGHGFDSEQLDLLFEPFALFSERIEDPAVNLHYARFFVEKSRGAISVESTPGAGSSFTLWLPESDFTEGDLAAQQM